MKYTAYTANADGSINVLAGSTNPAVFPAILPTGTTYEVHEGEVYSAGGKTYLSEDDPAYIEAKAEEEKDKALADLDAQYQQDKDELLKAYQTAVLYDDTEQIISLKADLQELDEQYDEAYAELEGEE